MVAHFPHLTRLAGKLVEIAGAACASACAAVLLGNLREPPYPPAPPIVQLAPADEQIIHYVRADGMARLDELHSARRHGAKGAPKSAATKIDDPSDPLANNY